MRLPWQRPKTDRRPRRLRPAVAPLEERVAAAVDVAITSVQPQILFPVTNRLVPVTVTGFIVSTRPTAPAVRYQVVDEYRRYEPGGRVELTPFPTGGYEFRTTILLPAAKGDDAAGRQYNILVSASDQDNAYGRYAGVIVPGQPVVKQHFYIPTPPPRPHRARR